jgi:Ca2+-binding EF-hand superfamily protein
MQASSDMEDLHAQGSGYIGEFSSEYINAEVFKLFDVDGSGKIDRNDLHECAKAMGWSE